jgi:hypothetical protein
MSGGKYRVLVAGGGGLNRGYVAKALIAGGHGEVVADIIPGEASYQVHKAGAVARRSPRHYGSPGSIQFLQCVGG